MFRYLKGNKYLLIFYLSLLISGTLNVGSTWGLYIARFCLENEAILSITSILAIVPSILLGMFIPLMTRKLDKFKLYYGTTVVSLLMIVARFFVGYHNLTSYLVITVLASIPMGITNTLTFMFTPDCAEYGRYKTDIAAPGITFATQTFFVKLQCALVTALGAFVLGLIGFVEGEGAVQAAGFVEGEGAVQAAGFAGTLWNVSLLLPAIGMIVSLVLLRLYKLNDHDVELMAKASSGEISREEAEAQMIHKY